MPEVILPPLNANAGLRVIYQKRLHRLVEAMHRSVRKWVLAAYRANEPAVTKLMAEDEAPAVTISKVVRELRKQWEAKFDEGAQSLADYFAKAASARTDEQLKAILKKAGFSIDFKMTAAQRDLIQAAIQENVSLIRSIPEQYFKDVEGSVMRSVSAGHDVGALAKELEQTYGVTRRRAAFIARDQNHKASAMLNRGRQMSLGITEAVWQHSGGGKHPRTSHLKAGRDKTRYNIVEGWLDPDVGQRIWPGTLPNCFPGDVLVDLVNGCHKVWRYHYRGDLIALEAGEATVRATPNHPLLTPKGWVAAQAINEGDYIWQSRLKKLDAGMQDRNQTKFSFADIFGALSRLSPRGVTSGQVGAVFNFHGDIPDSEVESVGAEFRLLRELNAGSDECVSKFDLAETNRGSVVVSSIVSQVGDPLATSGLGQTPKLGPAGALEAQMVGRTGASRRDAVALQPMGDNVSRDLEVLGDGKNAVALVEHPDDLRVREIVEILARRNSAASHDTKDHGGRDAECLRDAGDGIPGTVQGDDLVKVDVDAPMGSADPTVRDGIALSAEVLAQLARVNFEMGGKVFEAGEFVFQAVRVGKKLISKNTSGHVYTLQSNVGWYSTTTQGFVSKNCRCTARSIIEGFV
jgi:hypothetical protein